MKMNINLIDPNRKFHILFFFCHTVLPSCYYNVGFLRNRKWKMEKKKYAATRKIPSSTVEFFLITLALCRAAHAAPLHTKINKIR